MPLTIESFERHVATLTRAPATTICVLPIRGVTDRLRRAIMMCAALSLLLLAAPAVAASFARNFGGTTGIQASIRATATDAAGNLYIAGSIDGTVAVGGTTLTRIGAIDAFAAKLDSAGTVVWARNFGGSLAIAYAQALVIDAGGSVYLGGYFQDRNLTSPALTKIGNYDAFVFKLDGSSGALTWAKNFGGVGVFTQGQALTVDLTGIYLGGYFQNGSLSTPALTKLGGQDGFVFKLGTASGNVIWAKNFGGGAATFAYGQALASDGAGNVYFGGYSSGGLTTPALAAIGSQDAFVVKLDATLGGVTWARFFGGGGATTNGQALAVDGTGNVYLGGYFQGANLTTPVLSRVGSVDAFAFRLDPATGAPSWAKNFGGTGAFTYGQGVRSDGGGNVYLAGFFQFASLTIPTLTRIGITDAFAVKLDAITGATSWARNFGGNGADARAFAVATDGGGNAYLGGYSSGGDLSKPALANLGGQDALLVKIDGSSGTTISSAHYGGYAPGGTALVNGVAADNSGHEFIAGSFTGHTLTLGSTTLTRLGEQDAFIARLDASGSVQWAKSFGGPGFTVVNAFSVAPDSSGNVYVAGEVQSGSLTVPALPNIGFGDALVIKLDGNTGAVIWSRNFGGSGASASLGLLAPDNAGNVYVSGYFQGGNLTTPPLTWISLTGTDTFAVKLDAATGTIAWGKNFGGPGAFLLGGALAVNNAGAPYLAGHFTFANFTTPPLTRIGNTDAYVIKLDPATGAVSWARNFGGAAARAFAFALSTDAAGNAVVGGSFNFGNLTTPALTRIGTSDAYAMKLNVATGATVWANNFGGSGAVVFGRALAADSAGNFTLAGDFTTANLTSPPVARIGVRDAYTFKLDGSTGAVLLAKSFSGSGASVFGQGVAVNSTAATCLGGYFQDGNLTTPPLTRIGSKDALIVCAPDVATAAPVLDIDANQQYDALTDGLILLRYLFGLTGNSMISNAIGPGATRVDPAAITLYLDQVRPMLDIDDNGQTDALSDGLMVLRYLFGLRGNSVTAAAIGANAKRTLPTDIETYIQSLMP